MKLDEIIKSARADDKSAFGKVNDKRAVKILRAALQQVNRQIESTKSGNVAISGMGRFAIKDVDREKNGVKTTKRRVTFQPRDAGKKGKGKGKGKGK